MTNEEAIEVLNNWDMACPICEKRKSEEKGVCADCRFNKALDFAIKVLEERPQGDLISREALKKALKEKFDDFIPEGVYDEIDNAPSVEPEKALIANVTFDEDKLKEIVQTEVIDKIKSGELVLKDENPQGEWIAIEPYTHETFCPFCKEDTKDEVYGNFCPNCGADMRKGGAE